MFFNLIFGNKKCETCEALKALLEQERFEKQQVLKSLLETISPVPLDGPVQEKTYKAINSRIIPWHVRQAALEKEDRENARLRDLKDKEIEETKSNQLESIQVMTSIEELESNLGITGDKNETKVG